MGTAFPYGRLTFANIDRGYSVSASFGMTASVARLPTDPVGTHALTLNNVPAGARIFIRDQNDTTTLSDEVKVGDESVAYNKTLQVYAGGSPLNNWRIRVRKASGTPFYRPYETLMTATVGSSSIYVSMQADE